MSRLLKRVPSSFSWPLHQVWGGYLNPYLKLAGKCPDCKNDYDRVGGRPEANASLFHDQWYGWVGPCSMRQRTVPSRSRSPRTCPYCGMPPDDFADEETVVTDRVPTGRFTVLDGGKR